MNEPTLELIAGEISDAASGRRVGRVFTLGAARYSIDLRNGADLALFVSAEPQSPGTYLVKRGVRAIEKISRPETAFGAALRRNFSGAEVASVSKIQGERVVIIELLSRSELEGPSTGSLVLQLTGRSSNLFILDRERRIIDSLKDGNGAGQEMGDHYSPPDRPAAKMEHAAAFDQGSFATLSEALDNHFTKLEEKRRLESAYRSKRSGLSKDLKKQRRLLNSLESDLDNHGDPELWKRFGDLLLANASSARRGEKGFIVIDFYSENAEEIEIEADPRHTVAEAASECFRRYAKARNARIAIRERLDSVVNEVGKLEKELALVDAAFENEDTEFFSAPPEQRRQVKKKKAAAESGAARSFTSSDGFEILVGKRSKDNDYLTFRIARSLDTWMHAADYPGSHVVIRNPERKDIPHPTLLEAAALAAFYSKAKNESKAAVHYTLRKFVHKPKGARHGLVSLAEFKTLMVEPGIPDGVR